MAPIPRGAPALPHHRPIASRLATWALVADMGLALLAATMPLAGCARQSTRDDAATAGGATAPEPVLARASAVDGEAVAYFAGGCFWGVEYFLEKLPGVIAVESGYMGGKLDNPTYEDVLTHTTGHLEAVRVRYDPTKINYETIARRFFEIHDPTQKGGQGPDIGPQYESAVFVNDDAERKATEALITTLRERGYEVVTEVRDATAFYMAEDYHQDYYVRHQKLPYCHGPVDRFGDGD
jgi:methionine-S-sulfoxide reductase